ncbi:hypothetical protein LTR78_002515 [Recurvomyces mirabilis]|uniref:Uncharacterized protein n=1 Tax=Recurvomyces mirabilis TaxID=574656 RepID=A0AAE0WT62_9PEZI|nr:hypothetical protein LTR78_002515 [Recurvomyces mirabilis]KAK5157444.1 hypothetical protein LTS14_004209 [Recurvomyces mirabilis]
MEAHTATDPSIKWDQRKTTIIDVRGREQDFTLDKQGFSLHSSATTFKDFDNEEAIRAEYYKDVEEVARRITGATRGHASSHVKRMTHTGGQTPPIDKGSPAIMIHADYSYKGGLQRFDGERNSGEIPEDWEKLRQTRWGALSIWRPIGKVTRDALCLADKTTITEETLQPLTFTRSNGVTHELFTLKYAPGQQFYYKSLMGPDDLIAIKLFDTHEDVARCTPHSSFQLKEDYGEARSSIETRVLVFWADQPLHGNTDM